MPYYPPFPGRHELLTLALLELARERGVHDMSIRSLATAVRAAPGSLTYHYSDKEAMLATCTRFLGVWLHHDLEERLAAGGVGALLPHLDQDGEAERELARRLRVWFQLAAYGLNSPAVAAAVRAGEERIVAMFAGRDEAFDASAGPLVLWSALKSLAMAMLQPDASLSRDSAMAAVSWVEQALQFTGT